MPLPPEPFRPRRLAPLDPTETLARWWSRLASCLPSPFHYAIKRPSPQVPERIYYVTEGTCSSLPGLPIIPSFLHIVLLIFASLVHLTNLCLPVFPWLLSSYTGNDSG